MYLKVQKKQVYHRFAIRMAAAVLNEFSAFHRQPRRSDAFLRFVNPGKRRSQQTGVIRRLFKTRL
jgi:hypothetical protein